MAVIGRRDRKASSASSQAVSYLNHRCDIRKCNWAKVLRCKWTTMHSADTSSVLQPETLKGRMTYSTERHMQFTSLWPWHPLHCFHSYKPSNCINWNCNEEIRRLEKRQFRKTPIRCKILCSSKATSLSLVKCMWGVAIKLNLATMNSQSHASGNNLTRREKIQVFVLVHEKQSR